MLDEFMIYGDFRKIYYTNKSKKDLIGVVLTNINKGEFIDDFLYLELWDSIFDTIMYDGFSMNNLKLYFSCRSIKSSRLGVYLDLIVELKKLSRDGERFLDLLHKDCEFGIKDLSVYPTCFYTNDLKEKNSYYLFTNLKKSLPDYSVIEILKRNNVVLPYTLNEDRDYEGNTTNYDSLVEY